MTPFLENRTRLIDYDSWMPYLTNNNKTKSIQRKHARILRLSYQQCFMYKIIRQLPNSSWCTRKCFCYPAISVHVPCDHLLTKYHTGLVILNADQWAQSQGHDSIDRLERRGAESGSAQGSSLRSQMKASISHDEHWNCLKLMATLGKLLRQGGAHMGFSERIDTVLNWTELNNMAQAVSFPCATLPTWHSIQIKLLLF